MAEHESTSRDASANQDIAENPSGEQNVAENPSGDQNVAENPSGELPVKRRRKCVFNTSPSSAISLSTNENLSSQFGTQESINVNYICPICLHLLKEPHITKCGHTFCYICILSSLKHRNRCPVCSCFLNNPVEQVFPNFALNELVIKYVNQNESSSQSSTSNSNIASINRLLNEKSNEISQSDIDSLLWTLTQKRNQLEYNSQLGHQKLLRYFLSTLKNNIAKEFVKLSNKASITNTDLDIVSSRIPQIACTKKSYNVLNYTDEDDSVFDAESSSTSTKDSNNAVQFNDPFSPAELLSPPSGPRYDRMLNHFDDLTEWYFASRSKDLLLSDHENNSNNGDSDSSALDEFSVSLRKFTRYSGFKPLATLSYTTDIFNSSSIVSSIEFDNDKELFAIAGVTKRIKIYDYNIVINDSVDIHYPIYELTCNSKVSCVTWSSYFKSTLASSEYEGSVIVWDVHCGSKIKNFQEHEKRCWSVDFNKIDPKLLVSGSDDGRIKLWCTNLSNSVTTLEASANVCCVKFNPTSLYHVAFGSADHCIHYYDLRKTKNALGVFKGHRKAVSYINFLSNGAEVVSASTDSQLKLWDVNNSQCIRTFKGHVNEKNFVGLATEDDYITCGSENNFLYVYYKGFSKQIFSHPFNNFNSDKDKGGESNSLNEFVSALCWKRNSNVIIAANSHGTIKILELI